MVGGNFIEVLLRTSKVLVPLLKKTSSNFGWLSYQDSVVRDHHSVNKLSRMLFGNDAIKCHEFDVLHFHAVGASVVGLFAIEPSAHWEDMAGEQAHEAIDFGVGKGIEVGFADLLEIDANKGLA
jgi:hypothetical protein